MLMVIRPEAGEDLQVFDRTHQRSSTFCMIRGSGCDIYPGTGFQKRLKSGTMFAGPSVRMSGEKRSRGACR
jgi:hypothetical protein